VTTLPPQKEIVESMTDAIIALCARANSELNIRRKELIKPDLRGDYKHLCSASVLSSSLLFVDDLSKHVKNLTAVNKVFFRRKTGSKCVVTFPQQKVSTRQDKKICKLSSSTAEMVSRTYFLTLQK
jgi:hypothetical protein